jgi:chemotaxis protein methyltransferase CheR
MEISTQEFRDVQVLVRSLCGLVLSDDKSYLVRTRLEPVVRARGFQRFGDYLGCVQQVDAVLLRDELVEALTTGETSFNRDAHLYDAIRRFLLPELGESLRQRRESGFVHPTARLWSAGCSTGQEPYSLAMAVLDYIGGNPALQLRADQFPILATDVSARSLVTARAGRYPRRDLERGLTPDQLRRFFEADADNTHAVARRDLRNLIEFRRLNLMDSLPGLGPFEMILCRNVLIYFDPATRQRLCERFYDMLSPRGLLILGSAESLFGLDLPFASETIGGTVVFRRQERRSRL